MQAVAGRFLQCLRKLFLVPQSPLPYCPTRVSQASKISSAGDRVRRRSCVAVCLRGFRISMFPTQVAKMMDGSVGEVLTAPLMSSGFTCVYGARSLRLLVMYNRHLRGRWIRVLDEHAVMKDLSVIYLSGY